jgi:uncharacterized protein YjfI (DUF2170 family)
MPTINEYDALTGENTSVEISEEEYAAMIGDVSSDKSMAEIIAENDALKASAMAKLAALGLTEDEAKAIIG